MGVVLFRNNSEISIKELKALEAEIEKNLGLKSSIVEIPLNSTYFENGVLGAKVFDEFQRFIAQLGMSESKRVIGLLLVKEPVPIDFVEFTHDKRIIFAAARREDTYVTAVKALHLLGHALTIRKNYEYYLEHGFTHCRVDNCIMNPAVGHAGATSQGIFFCSDSLKEIKEGIKFLGLDKLLGLDKEWPQEVPVEVIEFEKAGKPKFSLRKLLTRTKYRLKHLRFLPVKKRAKPPLGEKGEISPLAASARFGAKSMQADELVDKTGLSGDALFPVDWDKTYSTKYIADMLDYYVQQSKRRQKKE